MSVPNKTISSAPEKEITDASVPPPRLPQTEPARTNRHAKPIQKETLFGLVVWYDPTPNNLNNIKSYIDDIQQLIIIDNSPDDNAALLDILDYQNILYVPNKTNEGIATALNQGCQIAIENGAQWVLTMDQDSHFNPNGLQDFIRKANAYTGFDKTAIFWPFHTYEDKAFDTHTWENEYTHETFLLTSGDLLSLDIYQQIGPFKDDFFIDQVDTEYYYRIITHGFESVRIQSVPLNHHLGNIIPIKLLWFKHSYRDHNPVRYYYMIRNSLYLLKLYPQYKRMTLRYVLKLLKRIILYHANKRVKLRFMLKGITDYRHGISGPLNVQ